MLELLLEDVQIVGGVTESVEINGQEVKLQKMEGIFMQCDKKNKNGRIYPKSVMREALESFQQKIDNKTAYGALDHPAHLEVKFEEASHLINNLYLDGSNVMGTATILPEGKGKIVGAALAVGGKVGVSSRGAGAVKMIKNEAYIEEGFKLITVDAVTDPSAHDAFLTSINESYKLIIEGNEVMKQKICVENNFSESQFNALQKFITNLATQRSVR